MILILSYISLFLSFFFMVLLILSYFNKDNLIKLRAVIVSIDKLNRSFKYTYTYKGNTYGPFLNTIDKISNDSYDIYIDSNNPSVPLDYMTNIIINDDDQFFGYIHSSVLILLIIFFLILGFVLYKYK